MFEYNVCVLINTKKENYW